MPRNKKKNYSLIDLLEHNLYEKELPDDEQEKPAEDEPDSETTEKDQERKTKDIEDIEKDDLEYDEEFSEKEVAASIKLNDNSKEGGGQIKLVDFKELSTLGSIEKILGLFKIDPKKDRGQFKDQIEISISSPIADFKSEQYVIRLMDGIGEISVYKEGGYSNTITKTGSGETMAAATDQNLSGEEEQEIDLSYMKALNFEFRQAVKNEYFSRVIARGE